jgi:hypothetical protein
VSKHKTDEGWVGPPYSTTDPACAARLQMLLEDRGVPALMQMRQWNTILPWQIGGFFRPTVYQVLVAPEDLEAHRSEVGAALAEVRRELGEGNEMDRYMYMTKTERT